MRYICEAAPRRLAFERPWAADAYDRFDSTRKGRVMRIVSLRTPIFASAATLALMAAGAASAAGYGGGGFHGGGAVSTAEATRVFVGP